MLFCVQTYAQDTLTYASAIAIALENNYGIRVARNTKLIAEKNAHPGNAGLLPSVSASSGVNYSVSDINLEFTGGIPPSDSKGAKSANYNASIDAQYTLFDGLGNIYNFQKLKNTAFLSDAQARLTIENTLVAVATAYFEVARSVENLNIARQALSISADRQEYKPAMSLEQPLSSIF